jgi:uncharacterized protein
MSEVFSPVTPAERIKSLDVLRGIAVLGILVMNIQSFSMIEAAYLNPTAYGDLTGINRWVWTLSHIFTDQKFMTIFSILFGAGILLFTERIEARQHSSRSLHYRRMLWLLIIGVLHGYIFWHGDILYSYAVCAMIAYMFRKLKPTRLLVTGLLVISVPSLLYLFFGWSIKYWPTEAYDMNLQWWQPSPASIEKELTLMRGDLSSQLVFRVPMTFMFQTFIFIIWNGWRIGGLMLAGMALYKWGFLSAQRSGKLYLITALIGYGIGIPIVVFGIQQNFNTGWVFNFSMFFGWQYNYWGSLLVSAGHITVIMLIMQSKLFQKLKIYFAAVGRTAFTNYLAQTLICTTIFYGHGFGMFGSVDRIHQLLTVVLIWLVQIPISVIWLKYFQYGPFEWLWRSLTYWKIQPMRIKPAVT